MLPFSISPRVRGRDGIVRLPVSLATRAGSLLQRKSKADSNYLAHKSFQWCPSTVLRLRTAASISAICFEEKRFKRNLGPCERSRYLEEHLWPENVAARRNDDRLVADVVAEVPVHPLGADAHPRVLRGPQRHGVVLLRPEEEPAAEHEAEQRGERYRRPGVAPYRVPQPVASTARPVSESEAPATNRFDERCKTGRK